MQLALGAGGQGIGIRRDKAVAIAMGMEPSHDQVLRRSAGRQAPTFLANGHQLAAAGHLLQKRLQVTPRSALQTQVVNELFEARHMLGLLGDVPEDLLFA